MKAQDLQPGDLFAYTVLSSTGDYEQHARLLEGGRFRKTNTGEEFEIKNPGAPVRLIRRESSGATLARALEALTRYTDLADAVREGRVSRDEAGDRLLEIEHEYRQLLETAPVVQY